MAALLNPRPKSAPILLAIDTSSGVTSLCVTRQGEVVKSVSVGFDEDRSEKLWLEIDLLVRDAGITIQDLDLFAVCVGPGGFTGLRVGMAAAKGFAVAANKPMIGVTSLEAAAANVKSTRPVLAILNAYKGEVYSQLFSANGQRGVVAENEPLVSTLGLALERVAHIDQVVFAGDAAIENAKAITEFASESRRDGSSQTSRAWSIGSPVSPAEGVARLALMRYLKGEAETPESVAACYVRRAEAELKLAKGLLGSKIDRVRRRI